MVLTVHFDEAARQLTNQQNVSPYLPVRSHMSFGIPNVSGPVHRKVEEGLRLEGKGGSVINKYLLSPLGSPTQHLTNYIQPSFGSIEANSPTKPTIKEIDYKSEVERLTISLKKQEQLLVIILSFQKKQFALILQKQKLLSQEKNRLQGEISTVRALLRAEGVTDIKSELLKSKIFIIISER